MATIDGSLTTMPLPLAKTSVLAVPRSIARSLEKKLKSMCRFIVDSVLLLPFPFISRVSRLPELLDGDRLPERGDLSFAVLGGNGDFIGADIGQGRGKVF